MLSEWKKLLPLCATKSCVMEFAWKPLDWEKAASLIAILRHDAEWRDLRAAIFDAYAKYERFLMAAVPNRTDPPTQSPSPLDGR